MKATQKVLKGFILFPPKGDGTGNTALCKEGIGRPPEPFKSTALHMHFVVLNSGCKIFPRKTSNVAT